jgi:tRNA (guanosine-2'-O-)-methyltransferase
MRRSGEGVVEAPLLSCTKIPWPEGWTARRVSETLEPFVTEQRASRLREVIDGRVGSVTLVMDAPHDPHNAAAVLRTCDAFGLPELHVIPRKEPLLLGRSVTRGTQRWVDLIQHASVEHAVEALEGRGFTLVATHPSGRWVPEDLAHVPRVALLLGNEHDGLCAELFAAAHETVRVPMRGFVESLNLSVAAAVLVSAATRGRPGDLEPSERELLYARGLYHSIPHAREILAAHEPS